MGNNSIFQQGESKVRRIILISIGVLALSGTGYVLWTQKMGPSPEEMSGDPTKPTRIRILGDRIDQRTWQADAEGRVRAVEEENRRIQSELDKLRDLQTLEARNQRLVLEKRIKELKKK